MKTIILTSFLLFLSAALANQDGYPNQPETDSRDDVAAYESFNSPTYGSPKSGVSGKGYPLPPPVTGYPPSAGYSAGYLNSLGYPYSYGMMPYTAPYYAPPYAAGYGYGAPSGYGYPVGYPYGNMLGRSAPYNAYGYGGYPGYGYRFGGLGYNAGLYRGPAAAPVYSAPAVPVAGKGNPLQYGYAPTAAQKLPVY